MWRFQGFRLFHLSFMGFRGSSRVSVGFQSHKERMPGIFSGIPGVLVGLSESDLRG